MARVSYWRRERAGLLVSACLLDLLLGDPPNLMHPVAWFGKATRLWEKQAPRDNSGRLAFGIASAVGLPLLYAAGGCLLVRAAGRSGRGPLEAALLKSTFAVRGLVLAAERVRRTLGADDLAPGREALRALVSRDVHDLDRRLIASAAIESLAENLVDSIVAPWLFYAIAGLPGAMAYRALNTLDAMWGYRDEEYEYLGKGTARLDDFANYVPATISARLLLLAGKLMGLGGKDGLRILKRDGGKTASLNAGRPMSAAAGLLGVELEKPGVYILGDPIRPLDQERIRKGQTLVVLAAVIWLGFVAGLLWPGQRQS